MRQIWGLEPTSSRILRSTYYLLSNYVALVAGVPTRMHFTDDYFIKRTIADKETGKPKTIESLVFYVDELNGKPASKSFSILSQKLAAHMIPLQKGEGLGPSPSIFTVRPGSYDIG
ncbi:hypothetical protein ES708_21061 [subsurface metagenome]